MDNPQPADLAVFHTYTPGAGPDGIRVRKSGSLYVRWRLQPDLGARPNGSETARYSGPAGTLPWANPANIAFDGHGALLVTNQASLTGLPDPSRCSPSSMSS